MKPAHFLLAVIRGEIAGRGKSNEECRAVDGILNRLIEKLAAFERRVLPDFDRAHAANTLRQLHVEMLTESRHPPGSLINRRIIDVRVTDKNIVLEAG